MFDYVLYALLLLISIFILSVIFTYVCGLFVKDKMYYKNSKFYRFLLHNWTKFMIVILRIKLHVKGLENVPTDKRFLLVSNHRSNFDPILTWHVFRKYDLSFISKAQNFKIPFFGKIIRKCCFMEIDRENPRNAIKTINIASDLILSNEVSVGVYPEGTRSKTLELLPFHNGVLKIAQKAKVPIVVLSIEGTETIHKNIPFKKSNIILNILKIYSVHEVTTSSTSILGNEIKDILENKLRG